VKTVQDYTNAIKAKLSSIEATSDIIEQVVYMGEIKLLARDCKVALEQGRLTLPEPVVDASEPESNS
jgi:hypothetical protein